MTLLALSQAQNSNHIRAMSGNKNEESTSNTSTKKPKAHTLRKFDDKIAVHIQRQEETKKQFQEAMRDIGEMKSDSYSLARFRNTLNLDYIRDGDIPSPHELPTNSSITSPPGSGSSIFPHRVEWNSVYRDYDEIKKLPSNKRPCRRRSTGHAHNDIRNSASPYPAIYYDNSIGGGSWDLTSPSNMNGNLISRVKSDSDLQKTLDMIAPPNIPIPGNYPGNFGTNAPPMLKQSTPDPALLHPYNHFPTRWNAARQRHTTMGHGPIRKNPSFSRKRAATSTENQKSYPPTSFNDFLPNCNTQVTSLPDLTDLNFHSGLERPIDFEDFSRNNPFTPPEHPQPLLSQHSQPNNGSHTNDDPSFPYQGIGVFPSHSQNPKLLTQQQHFGYFDDAYLHLPSEPNYGSNPKRMFNSSLSIQDTHHPLSYSRAPNMDMSNFSQNNRPLLQRQSTNTILTSQYNSHDPYNPMRLPLESLNLGPTINEAPFYSPNHTTPQDPQDIQSLNTRPSSARSVPGYSYSRDNISHLQQVRGLDLHSTITPENIYDTSNLNNFGSLQATPLNLHKSDPTLQTIGQTLPPPYPDSIGNHSDMINDSSLPFDEASVPTDHFYIPDDFQGQLKKGYSFDFNNINLTGNKTPVQENYSSFSKFSSVPKVMTSDYGMRNSRSHSNIDILIQQDAMRDCSSELFPEYANIFLPYLDHSVSPSFLDSCLN